MEGTGTVGYPTERRRSLNNFSTKRTVEDKFQIISNKLEDNFQQKSIVQWTQIREFDRNQCCGSGSVFRSFLDPDPYSEYVYGSTRANVG